MPQLMPFFWIMSVLMIVFIVIVFVLMFLLKNQEYLYMLDCKYKVIDFNFLW